jgi:hypothetical protein
MVEISNAKLKRYKLPGSDQVLTELIQAGGKILCSKILKLINSIWNKEELPDQWKESTIVSVHKNGDKTNCRLKLLLQNRYKSPGSDQIPAELIQAGGEILRSKIHKLINSIWNKEELPDQFTRRVIKLTVVIIVGYHCYQRRTKFYPIFFSKG